jgi:hypothetical protein
VLLAQVSSLNWYGATHGRNPGAPPQWGCNAGGPQEICPGHQGDQGPIDVAVVRVEGRASPEGTSPGGAADERSERRSHRHALGPRGTYRAPGNTGPRGVDMALISKPYARYSVLPICVHLMIGLVHPSSEALPLRQGKYPSIHVSLSPR